VQVSEPHKHLEALFETICIKYWTFSIIAAKRKDFDPDPFILEDPKIQIPKGKNVKFFLRDYPMKVIGTKNYHLSTDIPLKLLKRRFQITVRSFPCPSLRRRWRRYSSTRRPQPELQQMS
jgi:hypothetical protein